MQNKLKLKKPHPTPLLLVGEGIKQNSCPPQWKGKAREASKGKFLSPSMRGMPERQGELNFKAQNFSLKINSKKAFTLVEIIVAIIILAIL
jgi:prepilin-type N-terminal cleavage/methylation domain-containing protein